MPISFTLGNSTTTEEKKAPQATIGLKISKTLDGNLLINDHKYLDIIIVPSEGRIVTLPKPYAEKMFMIIKKILCTTFLKMA